MACGKETPRDEARDDADDLQVVSPATYSLLIAQEERDAETGKKTVVILTRSVKRAGVIRILHGILVPGAAYSTVRLTATRSTTIDAPRSSIGKAPAQTSMLMQLRPARLAVSIALE